MWKSVEDLLDYYVRLAKKLRHQEERLVRILDKMESPSSPNISGMPSSSQPDTSRFDGLLVKKSEMEKRIADLDNEMDETESEIEDLIDQLQDPDESALIQAKYIDSVEIPELKQWSELCKMLYGNRDDYEEAFENYRQRANRLWKRALRHLDAIYFRGQSETANVVANEPTGREKNDGD
ncbi:MAG: hypothetical protein IJH11_08255 [Lachnospiraceae bacterium]|nr:hypothetical protein [Lachnospiraceae bacterium]